MGHHRAGVLSAVARVNQDCADFEAVALGILGLEELVRAVEEGFRDIKNSVLDYGCVSEGEFLVILKDKAVASPERDLMPVFFEEPRPAQRVPVDGGAKLFGLRNQVEGGGLGEALTQERKYRQKKKYSSFHSESIEN